MSVITKNPGLRQACTGFAFIHSLCSSIHLSIFCCLSFFALQGQLSEQRQLPQHPVSPGCAKDLLGAGRARNTSPRKLPGGIDVR